MKRILSLLIVAALLATCLPMMGAVAEEEKYTYTILTNQAGVLDEDAYMVKYWSDYFGVNFEVESLESSSANELVPIRLAGDDTPDVLMWFRDRLMGLVEEGMYGTFPVEVVQKYAPKIYEEMAAKPGLIEYCSIDGELFTFGYMPTTSKYPSMGVWRTSWLEAIGEEAPETLEDAERVWYAFTNNDPDGNGVNDTYGMSRGGVDQVYNAYGLYTDWIKDEDGKLVHRNVSPRRREALEKLAQYYADGVLDPEFITGENNGGYWAVSHAFTSGRVGYSQLGNYSHWPMLFAGEVNAESFANAGAMFQTFPEEFTETSLPYTYADPLTGPYGDKTYGGASYTTTVGFSAQLIAEEARFGRLLEIAQEIGGYNDPEMYITSFMGEKGVHWDYNEAGEPVSFEGYQTVAERVAIGGLITFYFANSDAAVTAMDDATDKRYMNHLENEMDYRTSQVYVTGSLPSASDYQTELDKIASETFMDIITGMKDITAFDEMVETWYAIGGDILTQEANELYNK